MKTDSRFPRAKKSLGQNFLHDPGTVRKICSSLGSAQVKGWLEIGCGTGVLTSYLSSLDLPMVGVELDWSLLDSLKTFFERENQKLIGGSILEVPENEVLKILETPYGIVGNIPYNITSKIIEMLLGGYSQWSELYLMVQKEVGDRIIARPGTSSYGRLSVFCQLYSIPSKVLNVPAGCFQPPPKVDSVFIRLTALNRRLDGAFGRFLSSTVKTGFSQRRKKLKRVLAKDFAIDDILSAFERIDLKENCRAEELSPQCWLDFCKLLWEDSKHIHSSESI